MKLTKEVTIVFSIIFIALSIITNPVNAQFRLPQTESFKLKNGLQVTMVEFGDIPATHIQIIVNTGRKNETPGMQGISNITATSLQLGNKKFNRVAQDNLLYTLGAILTCESNDNFTKVSSQFLNSDLATGIELLAAVVQEPLFPKEDLSSAIKQTLDFNKLPKMDIGNLAGVFSDYTLYGTANPLGRYFYPAQLNKITQEQIKEFHAFNYTPKNTKIVVVGKFDKVKIKELFENYFGSWTAAFGETNSVSIDMLPVKVKEFYFVNKKGATQAALQWNKKAPAPGNKESLSFTLANMKLNDILFEQIRAKEGKTYGIHSTFDKNSNRENFSITTQVRNEVMFRTTESVEKVIGQFSDKGIDETQLNSLKVRLKNNLYNYQTPQEYSEFFNPLLHSDIEKRKLWLDEIEKIDLATINKVIKKYFSADSYKLVIVGDEEKLKPQLAGIRNLKRLEYSLLEVDN